ncbi:ABC transporter substrate-binding protein [Sphingomonas sp. SUN019]|uniref:ABC transporter substrate-binding protein n=1 Tax=Sphingomonas sp. SUN019 TaxID=2937788 RepID=UPI002164BBF1|nr:ABC transporter substrate-binding protein [Sphingomonas sp. SUN019]UVO49362.1 ABC transporter substrate-binding protein [Sphingomonas sp. SUN019]
MLADSIAQGLVRFDAAGQIEPGIAERWIVTDEGNSYIFRLRDAEWSDGKPVTAADIVTILKRQIAPGSHNPLAPYLTAIDSIVEMTPQVIQIELSRPRPDLLKLFAQPEMAIVRLRPPGGTGPFRIVRQGARSLRMTPVPDPNRAIDEQREPTPEDDVRLISERAARAIVRFAAKQSDLVTGGTIADWPLIAMTEVAPANIRLDPAAGLFGLTIVNREGFLAAVENRAAVAGAIDREALTETFTPDWTPTETLLPDQLDSTIPPAQPAWASVPLADRRIAGRNAVARWRGANRGAAPAVRVALPVGPGATTLWTRIAVDLMAIGVRPTRVGMDDDADLRLIDQVAPHDSARWYVANACAPCSTEATAAIEAARLAPTLGQRAAALAAADAALALDVSYIPIARPFRWSLVALRLRQWQANARAWHPLNRLRRDTN